MNYKIEYKTNKDLFQQIYSEEHIYKSLVLQMVNSLDELELQKFFKFKKIDPSEYNLDDLAGSERNKIKSLKDNFEILFEVNFDPSEFFTKDDLENRDNCFRNIKNH